LEEVLAVLQLDGYIAATGVQQEPAKSRKEQLIVH
jgi:hypothetical protein